MTQKICKVCEQEYNPVGLRGGSPENTCYACSKLVSRGLVAAVVIREASTAEHIMRTGKVLWLPADKAQKLHPKWKGIMAYMTEDVAQMIMDVAGLSVDEDSSGE